MVREKPERYITDRDVIKIIEEILPSILEKRPEIRRKLRSLFDNGGVSREELMAVLDEMRRQREEINRRFDAFDKRFEEMRKDANKRFEAMDRRFEEMREDTNKRFEEMREDTNRRFEKMREDTNRRFEEIRIDFHNAIDRSINALVKRIEEGEKKLSSKMDTIGSRWGILAEGSFRTALHELVSGLGFSARKWKKRDEGKVFLFPRDVEIDIVVKDGRTLAIEVKSSLTMGEVEDFERAVRFYEMSEGKKVDEKIILAIYAYPGVRDYASQMGIKIISEPEEIENK